MTSLPVPGDLTSPLCTPSAINNNGQIAATVGGAAVLLTRSGRRSRPAAGAITTLFCSLRRGCWNHDPFGPMIFETGVVHAPAYSQSQPGNGSGLGRRPLAHRWPVTLLSRVSAAEGTPPGPDDTTWAISSAIAACQQALPT